jgi:hypothetical protein
MKTFARANYTKKSTATGCGVLPAGTVARSETASPVFARFVTTWLDPVCALGLCWGIQCDPIEKKPFFHAHPGALAYSFGMLGGDLPCRYGQNWVTSQALRDPAAVVGPMRVTPVELVHDALPGGRVIVSTYNEPLITLKGSSRPVNS